MVELVEGLATAAHFEQHQSATLVRHEKTPDYSVEQITNENGFFGIEGLFRFSEQGLIERGLTVYEVGANSFTVIDPAPTSFIDLDMVNFFGETLEPLTLKVGQEDYSEAASLLPLPLNDGRPFPYNPVQKDAPDTDGQ